MEVSAPEGEMACGRPALRKYLLTATSVASCEKAAGTSASSILKTTSPSAPEILAGRRVHSTSSSTSCAVSPSRVTLRGTGRPRAPRDRGGSVGVRPPFLDRERTPPDSPHPVHSLSLL